MLGAGNLAWSLAPALQHAGVRVSHVWSRNAAKARELADSLGAPTLAVGSLDDVPRGEPLYVVALTDSAIADVARRMHGCGGIWAHTSASVEPAVMTPASPAVGVLYPLQTFTRGRRVELRDVPVFVEGSDAATLATLLAIAERLSNRVTVASTAGRRLLHVAAVFACNFTNRMLAVAHSLLASEGISLDVLRPLVEETVAKAMQADPAECQTGPARRGDLGVMELHERMLQERMPVALDLYKLISADITTAYSK